jgi:DNA processing protein
VILTDLVVERNDWARALVGRPSVYVATALEDVMTVVGEIIAERSALDAQLHSLLSA